MIEDHAYRHFDGSVWPYSVCHFIFEEINLGGSLIINLHGKNALILEAASGDFTLGADLRADGGDSSYTSGSGGFENWVDMTGFHLAPKMAMDPATNCVFQ